MSVDDRIDEELSGELKTKKTVRTKQNRANSFNLADMGRSMLRPYTSHCECVVLAGAGVATDQAVVEEVADADGEGDDAEGGGDPGVGLA
jgi:hypothetical protein